MGALPFCPPKTNSVSIFSPHSVEIYKHSPTSSFSLSFTTRGSTKKKMKNSLSRLSVGSYKVGGGFTDENTVVEIARSSLEIGIEGSPGSSNYEALLRGGEQVTSVLQEMVKLLEDMNMDTKSEEVVVELAAQGVIGQRVDQMESGFLMALDYMIQTTENDNDEQGGLGLKLESLQNVRF